MISIIIIVKNDKRVRLTLSKLQKIFLPKEKCEIIVVDASPSNKVVAPKDFSAIKWINYKAKKRKVTIPEQRNVGIQASCGEIIVFIDADCTPDKDWLVNLVKPIQEKKEYITAGTCIALPRSYMKVDESSSDEYLNECASMNMAISRRVFDDIGNFDESFERVSDSEICIRARKRGYRIRFVPDAIIFHDWGGLKMNLKRSYGSGKGRLTLYKKHPDQLMPPDLFNRKNIYSIAYSGYILLLPVSIIFPYYLILPFLPSLIFRRNPTKEIVNMAYGFGIIKEGIAPKRFKDV